MNKLFRALIALVSFGLCTSLFAASRTWDLGSLESSRTITIEMFVGSDYTYELINNSTNQTVAVLYTLCSFDYSTEDRYNQDYYSGSSGSPYLRCSWGSWSLENLPAGDYSIRVSDAMVPQDYYSLSGVY